MNYRMIAYTMGRILVTVAGTMLVPMFLSVYYHEGIFYAYLLPILISLALGAVAVIKEPKNKSLFVRDGLIIVALAWIVISLIGGLPFYISGEIPSFVDCFFETVSGFTTTGSTILTDVESMSKSLMFWRSFTHWLGGMGVLVFTTAIFTNKNTRTSHIMRAEMPGPKLGKLASRWQFSLRILYTIYIFLTVLEIILLLCGGMPLFDSIVHSFGTAGTGGFGIKNASIAFYNSAYVDYVIGVFMILFGINFNIYYLLLLRNFAQIRGNDEFKCYLGLVAGSTVIIALNIMPYYSGLKEAFRYSFFQVSSIMTTTGYATADFAKWPMLSQLILIMLMFIGGCAGSTGGGLKVIRVIILAKLSIAELRRTISPRSIKILKSEGKSIEPAIISGVLAYFVIYMLFIAVSILLVSIDNKDIITTVTSVIATVNNIGPGLGAVGPVGNFSEFSVLSKLVMSVGMLAGRLELYPILILFSAYTWKKA